MPKGKVKKSVKRNASKQLERRQEQEEINSLVQKVTDRKDESANPNIDNSCLNESINTSNLHCTVSSSSVNQDDSFGSPENGILLTENSSNMDLNKDFDCASGFGRQYDESISVPSKNVCFPSAPTPEPKLQKKNCETFRDIERILTHFDDIIITAASVAEHDAILKQVLNRGQANNVEDTTTSTEVPDQSLTLTEKIRLWAAEFNVKQSASSDLLKILKRFHPECF